MKVVAGLGNVGREYDGTRHNIGFAAVDRVADRLERATGWKAGRGDYYFTKGFWRNEEVLLIKPTTYMNLSGRAVREALQFYKAEICDFVAICDDIAIPLGALRLRPHGSDGGHNGLTSIIYELGTDQFARLRLGVGSDFRRGEQVRYVLGKFSSDELPIVSDMLMRAESAVFAITERGVLDAMNTVNYTPARGKDEGASRNSEV